ncbi:translation elongation factor EF-G [Bradyrhizobium erythrophlei]|uniref:Elongation factor G n=1 Tax=Bradyrhizobium erythrophlei TaxID=1437360 RepID=A0A1M7U7G5_9BRAD|nr:translation elongation factor EF-G [Bradyrhizobium erythrophlei]
MPDDDASRLPVIEVAIEPKTKADQQKLGEALAKLAAEDPSFVVSTDGESGQTILKGTSEEHLDAKVGFLKRDGINANIGAPQVAFRERITQRVEHSYTHKKQTGRTGQFASVTLIVEPNESGKGYEFETKIVGDAVPKEYIPGIEKGLESVLSSGVVAGFPVFDVKVQLIDGKYHDVDSSALAFEIAARACFREALQKGKPVLLEPIMKVEVVTPTDCAGAVIRDLRLRRSQITGQDTRSDVVVVHAMVPLMNMFGYASPLRENSSGRATFTMRFDHYAEAPPNVSGPDDPPFGPAIGMRA